MSCTIKNIGIKVTAAVSVAVILLLAVSCSNKSNNFRDNIGERDKVPSLAADSITTLISDSGRVKYRLFSKKYMVYDKLEDPYWYFPEKLHFESLDDSLNTDITIDCDTAYYFMKRKLWQLIRNVYVHNSKGETFKTSLLYWNQNTHKIYSDSFIKIEQKDVILSGYGFESNQSMTKYTIFNPNGPIFLDEDDSGADSRTSE